MISVDSFFDQEKECVFKDETYSVRNNGAVMRHARPNKIKRKLDEVWTFGTKNETNGYMYINSVRVHQIVAEAFLEPKPSPTHVIDHKDTNKCNNRPDNLRWATRLENALNNPITRKRIILCCGSIENFLENPALLRAGSVDQNFDWMRTVSPDEAKISKEKLERWGNIILRRPEPSAMWPVEKDEEWNNVSGTYYRYKDGGGHWEFNETLPEYWTINYKDLTFKVSPTNFKHTGLFPEQATNWDFMMEKIRNSNRKIKVLNLFAYTGAATIACSRAGADVVHVDASKGMVAWAKENMQLSHLENNYIRFIVDDCLKFVEREIRRGNKYDAIVMDPPSYGRGPSGEVWKLEHNLAYLVKKCSELLSDKPLFFLINAYTTGISSTVLYNILKITLEKKYGGKVDNGEIGLPISKNGLVLPCGIYGRWQN